ncbi:glycosyl transferase family 2 [Flavivirga aquatica]|uniref:Glycosyl transferase family 2 n=1 Tax=Flavivirga aquatica TaxID=1849968 RepID=A0A1E5T983_9FLAO|nr:TIGR04283 family arsenosugar biosynthesis glycosyltransferase [Flavivirga aquatica]OEK07867.1 glycosyl transferase family 2 [Flavivirga aquatica]
MKHQISIIIPMLNEADNISNLLDYLLNHSSKDNISEIICVDGGSTDGSQDIISCFISNTIKEFKEKNVNSLFPYLKLINSQKGRAKQMNSGTKHATGSILYFLHADSFPPKNFDQCIINEVQNGNQAGCFRMQFDSNHWWLKLASWLTRFSWRACRGGDQSQFITKTLFNNIGGFDERYVIYEDNVLINALYARKEFVVINKKLYTSARLYRKHGVWKLQYFFWTIYVKKWFGASPEGLKNYYLKHISVKN